MKRRKSPCINVCKFDGPKGWCVGCGRTRQECQNWQGLKPYAKNTLQKDLRKRISKMSALGSN